METIIWDSKLLSVGIDEFDEEHYELIKHLNELDQAVKTGAAKQTLELVLTHLIKYTRIHFGHEEKYMKKYSYPDYESHKREHEELTARVNEFYERYKSGQISFSIEVLKFLYNWLLNHILGCDMKYKEFFKGKKIQ
ncbi:MAG: hemerythrin family protein [Leptospiraceae bacterium]|nr:hemerythrin family protein [Leptospiraceae bacterium]MCP5499680.1 hemerythrin family protein [Leptospiraceae bacterium]